MMSKAVKKHVVASLAEHLQERDRTLFNALALLRTSNQDMVGELHNVQQSMTLLEGQYANMMGLLQNTLRTGKPASRKTPVVPDVPSL